MRLKICFKNGKEKYFDAKISDSDDVIDMLEDQLSFNENYFCFQGYKDNYLLVNTHCLQSITISND